MNRDKKIVEILFWFVPFVLVTLCVAFIVQEIVEDVYSEDLADLVLPLAFLGVIIVGWIKIVPVLRSIYFDTDLK